MKKNNYPGYLLTFEGIEGCGKTTQIEMLEQYLKGFGSSPAKHVVLTREPGNAGNIGGGIRSLLLNPDNGMNYRTELLLYGADRSEHYAADVIPALQEGKLVISDRSYDSTTAYQGYAREMDMDLIERINFIATFGIQTDLTFVLDLPVEEGLARAQKGEFGNRYDRIEQEAVEFHEKVRQGYLEIASKEPDRVKVIDAMLPKEEVASQIKNEVLCLFE